MEELNEQRLFFKRKSGKYLVLRQEKGLIK